MIDIGAAAQLMYATLSEHAQSAHNTKLGDPMGWYLRISHRVPDRIIALCDLDCNTIVVNKYHPLNQRKHLLDDTILHECAHALAGKQFSPTGRETYHGRVWKLWAKTLKISQYADVIISDEEANDICSWGPQLVISMPDVGEPQVVYSGDAPVENLRETGIAGVSAPLDTLWNISAVDYMHGKHRPKMLLQNRFL